ncbi:MAG: ABC transporter ATP-binding protein [Pseudomonadota bacterium]
MHDRLARFESVSVGYRDSLVFKDLDLTLPRGRITAFCGPNGSGKSTALRAMRGLLGLDAGIVRIGERPLSEWPMKDLAKEVAMLTQAPSAPEEISVADLVMLGRFTHRKPFAGPSAEDRNAVARAIAACDLADLSERSLGALSGGQLQRAWIAMVLAQDAPAILLDEPTNHLDIAHALDTLELIGRLKRSQNKSVVIVLHDLNLAAKYADHMVLFRSGKIAAEGSVSNVFTQETIARVFDIDCRVIQDPQLQRPICIPYPKRGAGLSDEPAIEDEKLATG